MMQDKFAPLSGTNEYIVGHHLLQAHAKAYRLYRRDFERSQKGKVGISLNINWFEPLDFTNPAHVQAAETKLQFFGGWFGHPIFVNGDYPPVMREKIRPISRLPSWTEEDKAEIFQSADFLGKYICT